MNVKSVPRYAKNVIHGKHTKKCSMCISIGEIALTIAQTTLSIFAWKKGVSAMNDELIKALRCEQYGDDECENAECPYWSELGCRNGVANRDAADAIERLTAEIDRKDKALQAWAKTWESRKENAIRHICDHCDTPIEVRLKEGACEDCPIKIVVKEIFEEGEQHD